MVSRSCMERPIHPFISAWLFFCSLSIDVTPRYPERTVSESRGRSHARIRRSCAALLLQEGVLGDPSDQTKSLALCSLYKLRSSLLRHLVLNAFSQYRQADAHSNIRTAELELRPTSTVCTVANLRWRCCTIPYPAYPLPLTPSWCGCLPWSCHP